MTQVHPALAGLGSGRCLVIGEVALSHDGSLGQAHAFIDAIASAGADAVKFQTHIAASESTPSEPFRVKFSRQDASRYAYWKRMEFTEEQWRGLKTHCDERHVLFISSPFSFEAIDLLTRVGQPLWKIASGEVSNVPLLDRVLDTGSPVLLSTGMSPLAETDAAVARITARGAKVGVLQCTTAYPCPPERVGLNLIPMYRERYGCWVGLSDHSGTIYPGLAGVATGHGHPRGPRRAVARDVRARRDRVGDDGGTAPAGGRDPLHRAHARQSARQGRLGA